MYKFVYTESNNEKASEFETKSLLYLLSMREDSSEIDTFIIDCFNDVTGANTNCKKLWDIQSKGIKSLNPKKIGISLITLFENYLSNISFSFYILMIPKLNDIYFKDPSINVFNSDNFYEKYISKMAEGLQEEYARRNQGKEINDSLNIIEEFIRGINFVIADDKKCSYIKKIIKSKKLLSKNDVFFDSIFDEIRDRQTILKNICIHNEEIEEPIEVLQFKKYLTRNEIEMLVINRLVGIDIFKFKGIPIDFYSIIRSHDDDKIRDIIQECNTEISLMLFNNNNKQVFWNFFELIYSALKRDRNITVEELYNSIQNDKIVQACKIKELSVKYFISLIKEGVTNENN